ncbi:hypothetical protein PGRAN_13858 [Listeria grandensis FSL F6-0971]|uniref:KAP NTPase domain-containing protein n=1 Tax=Listeria grandensis FSL F6-0971 TaxID=1265819 RepID=W7BAI1_9LIST|nr:P-loop NTPase fold protein [Listeria grandensis]EUJ21685.1 hypothetical protein PGRAN_13858 [Listeria grandensis FSL F6-0971]
MSKKHEAKNCISDDEFDLEVDVKKFTDEYISSDEYGTLFLNGKWGDGKTTFLNFVKEKNKGMENRAKIREINIWESNILNTPYQHVYQTIFPWKSYWLRLWYAVVKIVIYIIIALITSGTALYIAQFKNMSDPPDKIWICWGIILLVVGSVALIYKENINNRDWEVHYYKKIKSVFNLRRQKKICHIWFYLLNAAPIIYWLQ